MAVEAPPSEPRPAEIDRAELEALIEALIEEARQRARRRRRRTGAAVAVAGLLGIGAYLGFSHSGGGATNATQLGDHPSAAAATGSRGGVGQWQPSRGPAGGEVLALAVGSGAAYVGTPVGVYRTVDGGGTWTPAGLGGREIGSIAIDRAHPAMLYAAGRQGIDYDPRGQIYRSTNGGRSWRALGRVAGTISLDPAAPNVLYAAVEPWPAHAHELMKSTDSGRTWRAADRGLPRTEGWYSPLAVDPSNPRTLYLGVGHRLFTSTDGGGNWHVAGNARFLEVDALVFDPTRPNTVYVGTKHGLSKSVDGGRTWRVVSRTISFLQDRHAPSLVVDPRDPRILYASLLCRVMRSADGGRTWLPIDLGLARGCTGTWALEIDPRSSQKLFVLAFAEKGGLFTSADAGGHWRVAHDGLALTSVSSLAVDPRRPGTVYASTGVHGVFKSADGGTSWQLLSTRLGISDAVALDPGGTVLAAGLNRRVVKSVDAGRTWHLTGPGIVGAKRTTSLATNGETAYAGSIAGVFRTTNGGKSWRDVSPPGHPYVVGLALAPGGVYAAAMGTDSRSLYRTTDGGKTWTRAAGALKGLDVMSVAVDPASPATVYVGTVSDGVFKSVDGGTTWQASALGLPRIGTTMRSHGGEERRIVVIPEVAALAIDPAHPRTLYAGTRGRGVFESTDAGASWHAANRGLAVRTIISLAIGGGTVYAGTKGGGVATLRQ